MSAPTSTVNAAASRRVQAKLAALQTELVEQAYALERQGRVDAADVAITVAGQVGELWADLGAESSEREVNR